LSSKISFKKKVNLACGGVFVTGDGWINLDYSASTQGIQRADLLGRLPLPDDHVTLVYCSHFLEHIPRDQVAGFLAECRRILAPGGVLRLVLPDLENLCRAYLTHRERGDHEKADFVLLEMIDQCVRRESGGELGRYYRRLKSSPNSHAAMIDFVRERTGENLLGHSLGGSLQTWGAAAVHLMRAIQRRAEHVWTRGILLLLPKAFRAQNVSIAGVGELHHWLWDFEQLRTELERAGFETVERFSASDSSVFGFPFHPLDLDNDGRPRKGDSSMYIEAIKPEI
jgi:SAM-dependent methyltransferase